MKPKAVDIDYAPHPTLAKFHHDPSFVRGLRGPFGSGKSAGMCMEAWKLALQQVPADSDGIRHTRGGITRNTYGELKSTTIKTWLDWFPEEVFGQVKYDLPNSHRVRAALADGTTLDMEILFLALDRPQDVKKLKSLELTWAWMNEASEQPKEAFDVLCGRVGRYPSARMGGATHPCIFMDYNSPPTDHWLYHLAEEETPDGYNFFAQPPAAIIDPNGGIRSSEGDLYRVNTAAENIEYVGGKGKDAGIRYYTNLLQGKENSFIRVYGMGDYGFVGDGRPVFSQYNDSFHFSRKHLPIYRKLPLLLFWDFGLNCACLLAQMTPRGQLRVIDEIYEEGRSLGQFLDELLLPYLAQYYPDMVYKGWGDPSGAARSSLAERTAYDMLRERGLDIRPAPLPKNEFIIRKQAVDHFLSRSIDGMPAITIGPDCRMLHAGFLGRYKLARQIVPGEHNMYKEVPIKNPHSHPQDALQYGCVGILGPTFKGNKDDVMVAAAMHLAGAEQGGDKAVGY